MATSGGSLSWLRQPIRAVLCDIHGVIYTDWGERITPIPRSVDSLNRLMEAGMPLRLLSNGSSHAPDEVWRRCRNLGLNINRDHIFTPPPVALHLINSLKLRPFLLVDKHLESYFDDVDQSDPNCVLMADAGENFTYESLNAAFRVLVSSPEIRLFSMGQGRYYEGPEGEGLYMDVGAFMKALEYASGKKAQVIGKPSATYFTTVLEHLGLPSEQVVMIGDDVATDVGGAQKVGLRGVLVRTGKYRPSDEHHPEISPDGVVDDLDQAVELILNSNH